MPDYPAIAQLPSVELERVTRAERARSSRYISAWPALQSVRRQLSIAAAGDSVLPTITISPPALTALGTSPVTVAVSDNTGVGQVTIGAYYGAAYDVVWDGGSFGPGYSLSSRTVSGGIHTYQLRRSGGWVLPPIIRVRAVDTSGRIATAEASYRAPDPVVADSELAPDTDARSLLIYQYRGRPRIEAVLLAITNPILDIEADAAAIARARRLDYAEGVHLDRIGRIVDAPRGTLDDASYRGMLRGRLRALRASGGIEDYLETLRLLSEDMDLRVRDIYPHTVSVGVRTSLALAPSAVRSLIQTIRPAGIALDTSIAVTSAPVLRFDTAARGLGSAITSGLGGVMTSAG